MDTEISSIHVRELRCSLVWVSLLSKGGSFRKQYDYYNEFMNAVKNIGVWSVPWTENPPVVFWEKYLEKKKLVNNPPAHNNSTKACVLSFQKATGCVVPLRAKDLGKIGPANKAQANIQDLTVWIEGFAYPHGVACIINLRWRLKDGLKLEAMVDRIIELRNESYQLSNKTAIFCDRKGESLYEISQKILNDLSAKIKGEPYVNPNDSPYTVVTVVEADNAPLAGKPEADGILHQSLDAFCTFNRRWRRAKTSDLENALLKTQGAVKDDVLYARGLGRAVWLPGYFRQNMPPSKRKSIRYLGRYHRNITLSTMQAAYLSLFLKWVNEQSHGLTGDEQRWAKAAAGAVGRLYGPCKKSYMSDSLPKQISPFENAINSVRAKFIPSGNQLGKKK